MIWKKQVFVSKTFANLGILMVLHSNMILGIHFNFGGTVLWEAEVGICQGPSHSKPDISFIQSFIQHIFIVCYCVPFTVLDIWEEE